MNTSMEHTGSPENSVTLSVDDDCLRRSSKCHSGRAGCVREAARGREPEKRGRSGGVGIVRSSQDLSLRLACMHGSGTLHACMAGA
jgi:hypothetical protein